MTPDGRPAQVNHGNGVPQGPTIRGPYGQVLAWNPTTRRFDIELRPPKPPRRKGA